MHLSLGTVLDAHMPIEVNAAATRQILPLVQTNSCRNRANWPNISRLSALRQPIRRPRHLCSRKQRARCPSDCPC